MTTMLLMSNAFRCVSMNRVTNDPGVNPPKTSCVRVTYRGLQERSLISLSHSSLHYRQLCGSSPQIAMFPNLFFPQHIGTLCSTFSLVLLLICRLILSYYISYQHVAASFELSFIFCCRHTMASYYLNRLRI